MIDDPYKGPGDAASPTLRQKLIAWLRSVWLTRAEPTVVTVFEEDSPGQEEGLIRCERLDRLALRRLQPLATAIRLVAQQAPGKPAGPSAGLSAHPSGAIPGRRSRSLLPRSQAVAFDRQSQRHQN